jgi:hypothetical protein
MSETRGSVRLTGALSAVVHRGPMLARRRRIALALYHLRNLPARIRGAKQELMRLLRIGTVSELSATITHADGEYVLGPAALEKRGLPGWDLAELQTADGPMPIAYGPDCTRERRGVISRRVVSTAFVTALAENMAGDVTPTVSSYNWHASGTGTNAEAIGNTALQTEAATRSSGVQSNPSAGVYRTVATISYTGALAITEHGVFSANAAGVLLDRSVFAAMNVVNLDTITWTYDLTIAAGG